MLETRGCEKLSEDLEASANDHPLEALEQLSTRFTKPLEFCGVEISKIKNEFKSVIEYAVQYISLSTLTYQQFGGGYFMLLTCLSGQTY